MRAAGVAEEHIHVDKRTGAIMDRDGLTALLGFARPGDRINLLTLERLGRNMRETLNLVHDLSQRGILLRSLGDKLAADTSDRGPGTDMAIALAGRPAAGRSRRSRVSNHRTPRKGCLTAARVM